VRELDYRVRFLKEILMPNVPSSSLINFLHDVLFDLLSHNPAATVSESYVQNHLEFALILAPVTPRYFLRIGINYHGKKVQHISVDPTTGILVGWNAEGDALGTGSRAKVLLAGHTIFDRDPDEPIMNDMKTGGGSIRPGTYLRVEMKVRGWLGKTKNLDGKQLEKDIDLLKHDQADLLVLCLSETAHRKWCGEGPRHQAIRRTGCDRFSRLLVPMSALQGTDILEQNIEFEGQLWTVSSRRVVGLPGSIMPGAEHVVTMCWRPSSEF